MVNVCVNLVNWFDQCHRLGKFCVENFICGAIKFKPTIKCYVLGYKRARQMVKNCSLYFVEVL